MTQQTKTVLSDFWYYKVINFLFKISLGSFFLKWLLPTNPGSNNRMFRWFWIKIMNAKNGCYTKNGNTLKARIYAGILLMTIHSYFLFQGISSHAPIGWNILVNMYPIWVQIYIGTKCFGVIELRKRNERLATPC